MQRISQLARHGIIGHVYLCVLFWRTRTYSVLILLPKDRMYGITRRLALIVRRCLFLSRSPSRVANSTKRSCVGMFMLRTCEGQTTSTACRPDRSTLVITLI